ncbi:MAG TPA: FKBP-type peptidyl-prolyl cis-trans isomerase, partial [Bacteroidales bacterium]
MQIEKNTVATVTYTIYLDNITGEIIESSDAVNPRSMIFGVDRMIPGFEQKLTGLTSGEKFSFELSEEEAFGSYRNEMIINVPKSAFMMDGKIREDLLFVGNEIGMMDNHGNPIRGKIMQIDSDKVVMDFNHKLAGKKLFISGSVLDVRPVTDDDLAPKGGCCGGSCGCGSGESKAEASHEHGHHHHG